MNQIIKEIEDRIKLLVSEVEANEEENRFMNDEIDQLYGRLDYLKSKEIK